MGGCNGADMEEEEMFDEEGLNHAYAIELPADDDILDWMWTN